jgi:hypothetical protein
MFFYASSAITQLIFSQTLSFLQEHTGNAGTMAHHQRIYRHVQGTAQEQDRMNAAVSAQQEEF